MSLTSDQPFQIDSLLLIRSFAVIFEAKNSVGRLKFFDDPPQLIQIRENREQDGFDSPVALVNGNSELFNTWLRDHNIHLPIYHAIVLAYPKQIA